jgi:phosphatidylglycerol---prolipoprotein diacylglyceryl transferase
MRLFLEYPEWLSPVIIPGLPFRWYGMMYLVAFGVAYLLFMRQMKERRLAVDPDDVTNLFFWAIVSLLLGARIFAAVIYDPSGRYLARPWLVFWPFDEQMRFTGLQGMSYHGGVVGAVIGIVTYCRIKKIDVLEWGDMLCAAIPAGFTFGRLGNFINGELYGKVTTAPWGMIFPNAKRLDTRVSWVAETAQKLGIEFSEGAFVNLPRHPSQLYQAFFEGVVLWAILWFIVRHRKPFSGFVIGAYMIGYGFFRFVIEYFREPDEGLGYVLSLTGSDNPPQRFTSLLDFSTGQILSLLMILGGGILLYILYRRSLLSPRVQTFTNGAERSETRSPERRKIRRKLRKKK